MEQILIVYTNVPADFDAAGLARTPVERRLAACANILPAVQSVFRWQDVLEMTMESTLLLKTSASRYPAPEKAIRAARPYDVPDILAVAAVDGLPACLSWVREETRSDVDV